MPLSSNSVFGIGQLTAAINKIEPTPTLIRSLNLFKAEYKTTTYVQVEEKNGTLNLVGNVPRGTMGQGVSTSRKPPKTFSMLHLPKNDIIRADDVQNVRAFGTTNKTEAVADLVNEKLALMKGDIEYTREHLMLGALQGQILDADGQTVITDIYQEFGLTRTVNTWRAADNIAVNIDKLKLAYAKLLKGENMNGMIALVSPEFMEKLITHDSLKDIYTRYQDGSLYRTADTHVDFHHKGIDFIVYADDFGGNNKIKANEAIVLPKGTRNTFREFFAPADMNSAVNTIAQAYYAMREKLEFDKGWKLHAQSNPLPLVLRPELVQTIKMTKGANHDHTKQPTG